MILPGSYANGFAPRDGQPLYPELWRGCVGAWAPCLGPTGLTLRDWSGFARNASLTNMDASTDWVMSLGKTGLDLDGTNDWVDGAGFSQITFPMTLECWFIPRAVSGIQRLLTVHTRGTSSAFLSLAMDHATLRANSHNGASEASATGGTLSTGVLYHAAAVFRSITDREIFLNGRSVGTNTSSISAPASVNYAGIGALSWGSVIQFANAIIFEARISISANQKLIALSASRPGIAYELAPRRRSALVAGFNRRRRLLVGAH